MIGGRTATIALVQTPTPTPGDRGGQGEDFGKSSPVGFVVLLLFFIAVAFLVRSMNKHLRRVPASFDKPASDKPASDKPASDKPASDKPASDKPAGDKSAPDKSAPDKEPDPEQKPAGEPDANSR